MRICAHIVRVFRRAHGQQWSNEVDLWFYGVWTCSVRDQQKTHSEKDVFENCEHSLYIINCVCQHAIIYERKGVLCVKIHMVTKRTSPTTPLRARPDLRDFGLCLQSS